MSKKSPESRSMPAVVLVCADAVEAKLGRAPCVRQVKNREQWFITDPVFSFVQHGLRKGVTGYRVGYFYKEDDDSLGAL